MKVKRSTRKRMLTAGLFLALGFGGVQAMANPAITEPLNRFIHFYQATESANIPMSGFERLLYSLLLTSRG